MIAQRIQEIERQLAQLKAELKSKGIKQWEPVGGSWCIDTYGDAVEAESTDDCRMFGTERPTKSQANKARDEMRVFNRLLAYRDEFDPDFKEVWDDGRTANYFICFDNQSKSYGIDGNSIYKGTGVVYMSKEVAEELARKLNSGVVVLC